MYKKEQYLRKLIQKEIKNIFEEDDKSIEKRIKDALKYYSEHPQEGMKKVAEKYGIEEFTIMQHLNPFNLFK